MATATGSFGAGQGSIPDTDVAIVGAGISGIGMAAHMQLLSPDRSFTLIERRADLGGTWDLFRYPGIRSDSDMHTLGFVFEPWTHEKSIADGPSILEYLNRIVDERGIRKSIRFGTSVAAADWDSAAALWRIALTGADGTSSTMTARFIYLASGYYDYDEPYDAQLPGRDSFGGEIIHPQFWPKDFDATGKRIVVVGSGATAVTIVPSIADKAAHVTMLQRTPTWYAIRPAKDKLANTLRKWLPGQLAYRLTRFKNVHMQNLVFKRARKSPEKIKSYLSEQIRKTLGDKYDAPTFTPPYNPWEQRLCLVPDGDMFNAIKAGKAEIVTDTIRTIDATGIALNSGKHLDADVIVTATGLKMVMAGKIALSIDGAPIDFGQRYYYKGIMFSNVPNLAGVFGYVNASWTLRADINSQYVCRLLNHMKAAGVEAATPVMRPGSEPAEEDSFELSSGYIERGRHMMPKSGAAMPWRLNQDYLYDRAWLKSNPIDDGILAFTRDGTVSAAQPMLEAAE